MTDALREAAQAALEALECGDGETDRSHRCGHCDDYVDRNGPVRAALRAALAEPVPEPVAWQRRRLIPLGNPLDDDWVTVRTKAETRMPVEWRPLYVAQPAAPDLLSALKELTDTGAEAWGEDRPCVKQARVAIARAEGEA